MLFHDSHDTAYRKPLGAIAAGDTLTIRFQCDESENVTLRVWDGAEHKTIMHSTSEHMFEATITVPQVPSLIWYDFIIHRPGGDARYGTSHDQLGGIGSFYYGQPQSYQVTVYDPAYKTPEFLHHGIVYQIFPDRFMRDKNGMKGRVRKIAAAHPDATFHEEWNEAPTLDIDPDNSDNRALDFFGGTLRGIKQKLGYLKDMGVSVIYLNPVFRSRTNHRYDTGNYEEIDPIVGDQAAYDELIAAAKKQGIRIMMDGVFSHTGADSKYFNLFERYDNLGACQGPSSPYYDWYHFDEFPDRYDTWWGFYTLPAVNKDHPSYRSYLLNPDTGVLPRWVKKGACGWRLDVADELPMNLLREMRTSIKGADEQSVLLGEVWEDASNKIAYGKQRCYCLGDTLDSVMNYPLRRGVIDFFNGVIDANQLRRIILHQQEVYPTPFYYSLMNLLGSHDRVRILNAMAGYDQDGIIQMDREEAAKIKLGKRELKTAKKRYVEAVKLLCALPGAPTLYYGDEIGMTGMADPWNRAPMNWDDPDEKLHDDIAQLLTRRKHHHVLQTGYLSVEAPTEDTLVIKRYAEDGKDVFGEELSDKDMTIKVSRK
ncbi:MAG: glycoside hydrolase family 13 protein [Clostridiales bacterium]|nr:glycoside hydrolase family 13 protein [Clostridiales bacterium]